MSGFEGYAVESLSIEWRSRSTTPQNAVKAIRSNWNVFIHGASATPLPLVEALAQLHDLEGIKTYHLHLNGAEALATAKHIRPVSLFTGASLRSRVNDGTADFIPIFLSDVPNLFYSEAVELDVAIIQVSPPDSHGLCSLGTSVDAARAAVETAKMIIAEINEQMPRTFGDSAIHIDKIDHYIATDRPLSVHAMKAPSTAEEQIGTYIAELVGDGATLQMGIGAIPDAVLKRLGNKSDLGIHTEMFSDGLVDLFQTGAITNRKKKVHPGRIVTSFVTGTKKVFDFVHNNPLVEFHPCDRTNDTTLIRKNDNVVAINSALQIDLSGQVCADSLGYSIYSGIGGQMDFIRGAVLSKNGKAIIALPSTAARGTVSRIVPALTEGAGVVTTRGHVQFVATEYGIVNLHGKTLRERAEMLISIAHPDFRSELTSEVKKIRQY